MEPTRVEHYHDTSRSSGMGTVLAVVLLLILAYFLFSFGIPALRSGWGAPQVNVPGKIDVNVNQPK